MDDLVVEDAELIAQAEALDLHHQEAVDRFLDLVLELASTEEFQLIALGEIDREASGVPGLRRGAATIEHSVADGFAALVSLGGPEISQDRVKRRPFRTDCGGQHQSASSP